MDVKAILSHVDHTLLKPEATENQIKALCNETLQYGMACACVNPRYVPLAASILKDSAAVCTVIGFPLGATTTESKLFEAKDAIAKGAREIDMVIAIGDVKDKKFEAIEAEIHAVKQAVGDLILKVIIETALLTDAEKSMMCRVVADAGADYIKTSTGFSTGGATAHDIALFAQETGGRIKIKAAGGIRQVDDMQKFLSLGADRLGCSSAVKLLKEAGLL